MKERLLTLGYSMEKIDSLPKDEIARILALDSHSEVAVLPSGQTSRPRNRIKPVAPSVIHANEKNDKESQ